MYSICVASSVLLISAKGSRSMVVWWLKGWWCSYRRPGSKEMSCKPSLCFVKCDVDVDGWELVYVSRSSLESWPTLSSVVCCRGGIERRRIDSITG
ncbi:hypothetical protein B0T18DRAFT_404406 [Schizothecium vesticola]|uniref:Uncharacterized protein n=1 Tax=Schizothecium vesticola TaxID=314040 RepID=A0AA40F6Q2_9PEZI|nr:hypothetical protein B0T18DRAFT_404406 [Schizothecium vesticola]